MSNYLTEIIKTENKSEYRGEIKVIFFLSTRCSPTHRRA